MRWLWVSVVIGFDPCSGLAIVLLTIKSLAWIAAQGKANVRFAHCER